MSLNPFNPREPKIDDLGLRVKDQNPDLPPDIFLPRLPSSYIPARYEPGLTDRSMFIPIEPFYSPFYLGDAPLLALPTTIDRDPPFYEHAGATVATPCVFPYNWEEENVALRTIILDTVLDADATDEEKALTGYVPNPGLFLSSKTMQIYGQTKEGVAIEDIEEGWYCRITTSGDSDWTSIGSPDNNEGTEFYATGPGTGTGIATHIQEKYDDKNGVGFRWTYGQDMDEVFSSSVIKTGSRYKILTRGITSETLVDAEDIVVGWECRIESTGDTDWVAMGSPDDTVGTLFKCVATGSGTGTATHIVYDINYTTIGAANNNAGTEFTATGNGSGTGTVNVIWLKAAHCEVDQWYQIYVEGDTDWEAMGAPEHDPGEYYLTEFKCTATGAGTGIVYVLNPQTPHPILRTDQTRYVGIDGAAVGEAFEGEAFLPGEIGKFGSGTLVICAYRYGFLLSERKAWTIAVKIGRATATWDSITKDLTLECNTENAEIYYSLDGSEPATLYEDPINITETTTVRWRAKKDFMVDSDTWETSINYTGPTPPGDFETVYFSSLPVFNNSMITATVRLPFQPALYISVGGSGDGETPDAPMPLHEAVGLPEVSATALEDNSVYRIVRRKKSDGSGTETDFTLIGAPNNDIGTEFFATGAGAGDGAADLVGKARGLRTVTVTQITSAALSATKTRSGKLYRIKTVGTTNWKLIGAVSNSIDLEFEATGTGAGTGTADQIVPVGTLQLIRAGSEPAGCQVGTVQAEEIVKDRWYRIKTLGDTNWTSYGAPCNAVGVEFVANVDGGAGTGTATEIGAIEISIEADEVAATALDEGDRCTIKEVGTTDWTLIGASANEIGIEFTAIDAGTGDGKAWRRKWQHYTEPVEAGPCNVLIRRLRRTTSKVDEPPYTKDFVLPWFYGDIDLKTSWDFLTKRLTLSVDPVDQLDAKYIGFTYGVDSSDEQVYTAPIHISSPVTYKITVWHFGGKIPHDAGTYSFDEIEVTIDPESTASFSQTDTFTLTDFSYIDQTFIQPADILWLSEGAYTDAVYSNQAIILRGGYDTDYIERDIRNRKSILDFCKLGRKTTGIGTTVGVLDGVWASGNTTKDYWLGAATIYCCQAEFNKTLTENRNQILFDGDCYGCRTEVTYTGSCMIAVTLCTGEATDCSFTATVTSADGANRNNRDSVAELSIGTMVRGVLDLTVTSGNGWGGIPPFPLEGNGGNSEATIDVSCYGDVIGNVECTSGDGGDGYPTWDIGYGGASLATVDLGNAEENADLTVTVLSGTGGSSQFEGAFDWGGDSRAWLTIHAYRGSNVYALVTAGDGGDGGGPWSESGISYAKLSSYVCHPTMTAILAYGSQGVGIDRELTGAEWSQPYEPTYIDPALLDVRGMNLYNGNYEHPDAYTRPSGTTWTGWYSGTPNGDGAPLRGYESKQGTGIVLGRYWE